MFHRIRRYLLIFLMRNYGGRQIWVVWYTCRPFLCLVARSDRIGRDLSLLSQNSRHSPRHYMPVILGDEAIANVYIVSRKAYPVVTGERRASKHHLKERELRIDVTAD